jgi:hemerythrin-like domain-containing protein
MPTPTDVLRDEHRVILRALDVLEMAAAQLVRGRPLPDGWWPEIIAWLRSFADKNHHAKEESSLFPAMVKAGVPSEGGPIAVMLEEHERGRALVRAMEAGAAAARAAKAREYVALLREHIDKENGVLFPMADAVLDDRAQGALAREFEAVEAELGRDASISHAEAAVERLQAALAA